MSDVFAAAVQPGIGHNMDDSLPTVDQIAEGLEKANTDALVRVDELLTKGHQYTAISSDAADEAATQFMVALRARWKASEADRVADKSPWDDRAGAVQAFYKKRILDQLSALGERINGAQTVFKKAKAEEERKRREDEAKRAREAEQAAARVRAAEEAARRAEEDRQRQAAAQAAQEARRKAEEEAAAAARKRNEANKAVAEEAARKAREAAVAAEAQALADEERIAAERAQRYEEARLEENRLAEERAAAEEAAAAPLADLSRARGEKGGISSLRQVTAWRDVDRAKLDYAALGPYFKEAHIDAALKGYADANKATVQTGIKTGNQPIRGVVFFLDARNSGRA